MIQERKIGGVKHAVSHARHECGQVQSPNTRRRREQETGRCQETDTQTQNAMRAPPLSADRRDINGLPITRSTNSVTDVVAGVTLNLAAADATKHVNLTVARDTDAVASKINDFISAYNKLSSTVTNLHQKGGTLEADNSATSVISQLQGVFNQPANITGGSYSWLAQIGVSFQKDGTLALDKDAFSKAMNTDFKGVVSLFTDTTSGFAGRLYTAASNMLDTNGLLDSRISGLNTRINSLDDNIDRENVRLTSVETRLRKQYASLDSLLGTMKNTSNYLASQLK